MNSSSGDSNSSDGNSYDASDDSGRSISEDDDLQLGDKNDPRGAKLRTKPRDRLLAKAEWAKMPSAWDQVDIDSDAKFFNLVEGEAEENRLNQKAEAEHIAQHDFNSIELIDPLTN